MKVESRLQKLGGSGAKEKQAVRANCAFQRFDNDGHEENGMVPRGGSRIEATFKKCGLEYFCRLKGEKMKLVKS